jgi:hypothetical protein
VDVVRVVVEHRCRRLDLSPVERLVPAAAAEWAAARFGPDGRVLAPSQEPDDRLRLTAGAHDHPRATYLLAVGDDQGDVQQVQVRLGARSASGERRELDVRPAGAEPAGVWSATVRLADLPRGPLEKGRLPSASGEVEVDLRAVAAQEAAPAWARALLAVVVGSRLHVGADLDPAALSGPTRRTVARASGRCGRWSAALVVDVDAGTDWRLTCTLDLTATGIGRPVLAVVGARRVQGWLRQALEQVAGPSVVDEAERDLRRTEAATAAAGGPAPHVRTLVWGDGRAVVGGAT